jgi:hypothetical protein
MSATSEALSPRHHDVKISTPSNQERRHRHFGGVLHPDMEQGPATPSLPPCGAKLRADHASLQHRRQCLPRRNTHHHARWPRSMRESLPLQDKIVITIKTYIHATDDSPMSILTFNMREDAIQWVNEHPDTIFSIKEETRAAPPQDAQHLHRRANRAEERDTAVEVRAPYL